MVTIAAAARQTGISAATLRKWEARYGFPAPLRTEGRHRSFQPSDLEALLEIARRMAAGQRAGACIAAVRQGMEMDVDMATDQLARAASCYPKEVTLALKLLHQNELQPLEDGMHKHFAKRGAAAFSLGFAIPVLQAIGDLWQQGRLPIYAERLFSHALQRVLQHAGVRRRVRQPDLPHVLLASPAGERHGLALVMLEAMLHEADVACILLPGGLPAAQIAAAARAFKVQVVALSASVACPPKLLADELRSLRAQLQTPVELWVGGAGTHHMSSRLDGVRVICAMDEAVQALKNRRGLNPHTAGAQRDHH